MAFIWQKLGFRNVAEFRHTKSGKERKRVFIRSRPLWASQQWALSLCSSYRSYLDGFTGFCVGVIGDLIFLISVLCMKDSWRAGIPEKDKTKLVTDGIYKYSRNPAFLGFDFQYIGISLIYFNLLTLIFTIFAVTMLHLQILQEEKYLTATFGAEYQSYQRQVFRYLGRKREK